MNNEQQRLYPIHPYYPTPEGEQAADEVLRRVQNERAFVDLQDELEVEHHLPAVEEVWR